MAWPGLVLPTMVEGAVLHCARALGVVGLDYNWMSVTKTPAIEMPLYAMREFGALEFGALEPARSHESEARSLVKQQELLAEPQVAVLVHVAERFREYVFPIFAQVLVRKPHLGKTRCRKRPCKR